MAQMDFVTIDFEASCLPRHGRSFPIEVGIAGADGTRSWLIKPHPLWREWDWTEEAFSLHGISREQLDAEGLEPEFVFAALCQSIDGRRVIADSIIDASWWSTLSEAAGQHAPSPIEHVGTIFDELGLTTHQILSARQQADLLCRERHRADVDARWLWAVITSIRQTVAHADPALPWRPPFTPSFPQASEHRDAITQSYLAMLPQPRSPWSWEVELRPSVENF